MRQKRRSTRTPGSIRVNAESQPLELAPLRFSESPLSIQVIPPAKKKDSRPWLQRYWPWCLLFLITVVILFFWAAYILPQNTLPTGPLTSGNLTTIAIGFSAPSYVFLSDENAVKVTVLNTSDLSFNGTITLVFSQGASLSIAPEPDGNTSFTVTDLPSKAQISRRIGFTLNEYPTGRTFKFQLKAETTDGRSGNTNWQNIRVGPFPFLHRILKYLAGTSLFAVFVSLFWERFKVLLFPG